MYFTWRLPAPARRFPPPRSLWRRSTIHLVLERHTGRPAILPLLSSPVGRPTSVISLHLWGAPAPPWSHPVVSFPLWRISPSVRRPPPTKDEKITCNYTATFRYLLVNVCKISNALISIRLKAVKFFIHCNILITEVAPAFKSDV